MVDGWKGNNQMPPQHPAVDSSSHTFFNSPHTCVWFSFAVVLGYQRRRKSWGIPFRSDKK